MKKIKAANNSDLGKNQNFEILGYWLSSDIFPSLGKKTTVGYHIHFGVMIQKLCGKMRKYAAKCGEKRTA